jgi:uncharacterized membrane protein YfcA
MHLDSGIIIAGLIVGFVIGMTGVGGGALLTPVLIIFFGISAPAAVSSDIVASLVLKPIGGAVHFKRGTVNLPLVGWLALGSVPGALAGVYMLTHVIGNNAENFIKTTLAWILLVAVVAILAKAVLQARRRLEPAEPGTITLRPVPSVLIGLVGGFIVGLTSVGSGSLMIVLLMILYPRLSMREMIGTDLVQAIPLVASAAIGITLWSHLQFSLIGSLLLGAVPAVWLGAHFSSRARDGYIRPVLVLAMSFSALKLLGVSNQVLGALAMVGAVLTVASVTTLWFRARDNAPQTVEPELATSAAV